MRSYPISIQNMQDCQKYLNLLQQFSFKACIVGNGFFADACDVLDILSHYPLNDLQLILVDSDADNQTAIEKYLTDSGLLQNTV